MKEKKECKSNAITARISANDLEILDDLSEYTNKTKSDTITRAVKFWRNIAGGGDVFVEDEVEMWGKVPKNVRVNLRVTDSDRVIFSDCSEKTGLSISQIIRKSIREYHNSIHR